MATPDLLLLHLPWGLLRSPLQAALHGPDKPPETGQSIAPLVFARDDQPPLLNGGADQPALYVEFRTNAGETQSLWELPVPLQALATQKIGFHLWRSAVDVVWKRGVDRPTLAGRGDDEDADEEPGTPLYRFLRTLRARMWDFEAGREGGGEVWRNVLGLWLDSAAVRDPMMDVLVLHARAHKRLWNDLAEHPRRLLSRRREQVALSRVQELDVQCMQWLTRQPGRTLAERAGARQRILALARFENRDTLENRVFRDLMFRSVAAARDYLALNKGRVGRKGSGRAARLALVQAYRRDCRRIEVEFAAQDVSRQIEPTQPNYVLLHDTKYQHVWSAREELIRREQVMDDLWRWQRRSWTEFCKAVMAASLQWISGSELVFASPLSVRTEHDRGCWLVHDDPFVVVAHPQGDWVAEVLAGSSDEIPKILRELGAAFWVRFADMRGGDYQYLAVWTIHALASPLPLAELVDSANTALAMARSLPQLAGGLVLASLVYPTDETHTAQAEHVSGCAFGPSEVQLSIALQRIGEDVQAWIEELVCVP